MVNQGFFDEFVFVFYFGDIEGESEVIFGGVDKFCYEGKIEWILFCCKVYWEVDFDFIVYGDEVVEFENIGVILDIGIFFNVIFSFFVEFFNFEMGVKKGYNGQYIIECEKCNIFFDIIFFLFGFNYSFFVIDYIFEVFGSCIFIFQGMDIFEFVGFFVIFGDVFFCRYYFVYDFGNNVVGFVRVK